MKIRDSGVFLLLILKTLKRCAVETLDSPKKRAFASAKALTKTTLSAACRAETAGATLCF